MAHGAASIEFQMMLLLFMSLAGYLAASRIGQPAVVGIILAGIAVGPSVLDLITYTDFVSSIAHIGAIVLLFVIGLEFKLAAIAKMKYAVIALFGIVIPWAGGYFVAIWFDFESTRAIIIGVALSATSIAITADTLREMGKLDSPVAEAIIGAAVIDDVLALLALAVARQLYAGELSIPDVSIIALKAAAFVVIGAIVGKLLFSRAVQRIDASTIAERYPDFVFIFAMMAAFLYALVAEIMGLSAIVGAFVAGISLEGVHLKKSKDIEEGAEYLRIIFGSIFFISLGVLADLSTVTWEVLWFTLALTVVAIATKVVGCGVPAFFYGFSRRDAAVIGTGMAPRGEVAMIIALLALNEGIIEQPSFVGLVLMSLLTTLVVPIVLKNWLYRGELSGG